MKSQTYQTLLVVVGFMYILCFVYVSLSRMSYPFELEWLEGGILENVRRIFNDENVYSSPSLEHVGFTKTPAYYYLGALVSQLFGVNFFSLRLISFISTLGIAYLIYQLVIKETRNKFSAFISVAFFFALFKASGAWYDTARVDMLFNFFILMVIYTLNYSNNIRGQVFAGFFFCLAFLTKQLAIFILLPIFLFQLLRDFSRGAAFLVSAISFTTVGSIYLNVTTGGWFYYYIFDIPREHSIINDMWYMFWVKDIALTIPVLFIFILYAMYKPFVTFLKVKSVEKFRDVSFYILIIGSLAGLGWVGRLNTGGYYNVLIPAYIGFVVAAGISLTKILNEKRFKDNKIQVYLLLLAQFVILTYNPIPLIPTKADKLHGELIVKIIEETPGEIFIPYHNYLLSYANKNTHTHLSSLMEINGNYGGGTDEHTNEVFSNIQDNIKNKSYSYIILDQLNTPLIDSWGIENYYDLYTPNELLSVGEDTFYPVTGMRVRPTYFYTPKAN